MDKDTGTITAGIRSLRRGDSAACEVLWEFYFARTSQLAKGGFSSSDRSLDEEDVAGRALESVFAYLQNRARPEQVESMSRDELWMLISASTKKKLIDLHRRRAAVVRGGNVHRVDTSMSGIPSPDPTPEEIAVWQDELSALFGRLDSDQLRAIARMRLAGCETREIAESLGISSRSVTRKIKRIYECWLDAVTPTMGE